MIAFGWFVLGLAVLIVGAELVVRGGSRFAARLGVPPILIGLTVVSVGTSMPELAVGIDAALQGSPALAVGNIAGTNTVNLLLILGLSALLKPLALQMQTLRFDLPAMIAAAFALMTMAWDGVLTRIEGGVLVAAAIAYTIAIVYWARRESRVVKAAFTEEYAAPRSPHPRRDTAWNLAALVGGIAVLLVGADWLVDGAVEMAQILGVSDALIGLTVVAIGTSSPELVTTVVSTLRQERDIAIGNLLGSSVYNIALILGVTCLVPAAGIAVEPALVRVDIPVMIAATVACIPVFWSGRSVSRLEGGLFVGAYLAYLAYLVIART